MRLPAKIHLRLAAFFLAFLALPALATTYYVDINSTNPTPPYTNWSTASRGIQTAVNEATNGDLVLVNSGTYASGLFHFNDPSNQNLGILSQVGIPGGVTVSSLNGPATTIIRGTGFTCVALIGNATLSGFTLTNGVIPSGFGAGAYCQTTNAFISDCIICSNVAPSGGGVYLGTLSNCTLIGNTATDNGGGAYGSVLNNCTLIGNTAQNDGGGAFNSVLNGCSLIGNSVGNAGSAAFEGSLNNCLIISNTFVPFTGVSSTLCSNTLNNCLILNNETKTSSAILTSTLTNCTICYNMDGDSDQTVLNSTLRNCIVYYNNNGFGIYYGNSLENCCIQSFAPVNDSTNGITNAPIFVNITNDFHLQSNSPCINSGNNAYVTTATDLDGNPRIVGGTVDIGCYEYQTPTSVISYAYLQQYGLPTDGSVDFADLDGTAFNVYQDWIAGLNPTNPASVLVMLPPVSTNTTSGITVTWQSVSGILYNLQRSTNLTVQPPFSTIRANITGNTGTTSYTDTSATNGTPYFYRVGVP